MVFYDEYLDKVWRPKNDTNTFLGPIPMREALYKSRNMVSIRILQALGVDRARNCISKFGLNKDDLPPNLSMALGTATLTPMEIASAWTVFANGGFKVSPYIVQRIESRDGQVLYQANPPSIPQNEEQVQAQPQPAPADAFGNDDPSQAKTTIEPAAAERVIDARTAYIMTSMLQDVIKRGTGRRALALKRDDLAGKTGTTNESKDAWFSGFNADFMTTVWVGFDQPESLGRA